MQSPVFRLEGVIRTKNETQDFEGPLSLILTLLSRDKIEIRDISISLILEQYLAYLDEMASLDLDIASEFVAMASHLAYIKTKVLLSDGEEVSELEQLISSLEDLRRGDAYAQIQAVTGLLRDMYKRGAAMLIKPPEFLPVDSGYRYEHDKADLLAAVTRLIGREDLRKSSINTRSESYPHRIVYSIPEKISEILLRLRGSGELPVSELFERSRSRTEIVATLIAVLELCKAGGAVLSGEDGELTISGGILPEGFDITLPDDGDWE